jgi:ribulose-5-phosphate 4-epimerase/fuculose-1-phosphate aldolase
MGAGDVGAPGPTPAGERAPSPVGAIDAFRQAGRALSSMQLVRGSEGNLSVWDGERLLITRTGAMLDSLGPRDVLQGTLKRPPAGASSDLHLHVAFYRDRGPGAVAHAHPPGSVPDEVLGGRPHGGYAFGPDLGDAVAQIVAGGAVPR